jgi:hypothetical protein
VALGSCLLLGDWRRRRLRHGCRAGFVPVLTLMGHTDTATTRRYVHLNLERLRGIQERARG